MKRIILILCTLILIGCKDSCRVGYDEVTEYNNTIDSLEAIVIDLHSKNIYLESELQKLNIQADKLRKNIKPAKEIIKYEEARIDSFIRSSTDMQKRDFLSRHLRD